MEKKLLLCQPNLKRDLPMIVSMCALAIIYNENIFTKTTFSCEYHGAGCLGHGDQGGVCGVVIPP